jgi:hypothetical protein
MWTEVFCVFALALAFGCSSGPAAPGGGGGGSGSGGTGGTGHFFGAVEVPGLEPSACAKAVPEPEFAVLSENAGPLPGPFVLLTGTLPDQKDGDKRVIVNGAPRGVRKDPTHPVWTYFLAVASGPRDLSAELESSSEQRVTRSITVDSATHAARHLNDEHTVGTWMFTSFGESTSLGCASPWRPESGFESWDGSVHWAREQLLDQIDAQIDLVGVQVDPLESASTMSSVLQAAGDLLDEGILPPRLFPLLDLRGTNAEGASLDLASDEGRLALYELARAFYDAADTILGERALSAVTARVGERPMIAAGRVPEPQGLSDEVVADFRARFARDFGRDCYLIAPSDVWPETGVDELTPLLGATAHSEVGGHDGDGFPTVNLTPGFWDPEQSERFLARGAGAGFARAWQSAVDARESARHVWIDTWNDARRGSGIFAAEPTSYDSSDGGPCGEFLNRHDDSWGEQSRLYIDATRSHAQRFRADIELDAAPLVSDVPSRLRVGERRYVTVVMQNRGAKTWTHGRHKVGLTFSGAATGFRIDDLADFQDDDVAERLGGIARGMAGVFTVLLTAPCTPGNHLLAMEVYDFNAGGFGTQLQWEVTVSP